MSNTIQGNHRHLHGSHLSVQASAKQPKHKASESSSPTDHVQLTGEQGHHDPGFVPNLVNGLAKLPELAERTHGAVENATNVSMNALRKAPKALEEIGEHGGLKTLARYAPVLTWGNCLRQEFEAINNPHLSEHEKSAKIWGAVGEAAGSTLGAAGGGAVGAVGGGVVGGAPGMFVGGAGLGIAGAIKGGELGEHLGEQFGEWLVPGKGHGHH